MNWKKHQVPILLLLLILVYSCASIGRPDGGPYDEDPPKFVKSTPVPFATKNKEKKIVIEFDEIVKLDKPSEKVVISPPQLEQPDIKANGRKIVVGLIDTLKAETTYTIDFSDAIQDNNEGNPLGSYSFTFSTGESIDTMEVAGHVLNAADLEPIKNIMVGLHADLADSAFTTKPFDRVSRTDSRGHFVIRGVAAGKYRIFALNDGNQNYIYDSRTELIAFSDSLIIPSQEGATRQDTIWKDSITIDTIKTVGYTHYMPDNVLLRAFKAENDRQYLKQNTRDKENHFVLVFGAKADTLPTLKGLNFDEKDAFIIEKTLRNDSICYWIKDSLVYNQDTLEVELTYLATDDSLKTLVSKTDTVYLANKTTREQRLKQQQKAEEEKAKQQKKNKKKGDEKVEEKVDFLPMKVDAPATLDLDKNIILTFEEPLLRIDTAMIRVEQKIDTLYSPIPSIFLADSTEYRKYIVLANWEPENEYRLTIDSLAFTGLYGRFTDKASHSFKTAKLDDYGTLLFNIVGAEQPAIVQLLDNSGKVLREQAVDADNTADFYFLKPGSKYYIRLFYDRNGNGIWDTGDYDSKVQPEEVFYFPKSWEMKANFEFEETWNLNQVAPEKQKMDEIKKQKPEEEKKVKDRNAQRLKKLGRTK